MTPDSIIGTAFVLLLAFDIVLMVILARKWAPRCLKCNGTNLQVLNSYDEAWTAVRAGHACVDPTQAPVKVCRRCGYVEVL